MDRSAITSASTTSLPAGSPDLVQQNLAAPIAHGLPARFGLRLQLLVLLIGHFDSHRAVAYCGHGFNSCSG
jgi:hypothetical protein